MGDGLDAQLDKLTTYRLVLYLLCIYVGVASLLGFAGKLGFSGLSILGSVVWLVAVCRATNWSISKFFKLPRNHESDLISALILSLILTPASDLHSYVVLAGAGVAAMGSKYLLTFYRRHIFNPAALGAFISGILFHQYASWWVGTHTLAPFLLIGGLLILRKMKRTQIVGLFVFIYLAYLILHSSTGITGHLIWVGLVSTPLLFFTTVMLTEPLTSPTSFRKGLVYAAVVGLLYSVAAAHFSPEKALLAGNVLAFAMTPSRSLLYKLINRSKEAEGIYSFTFESPRKINFQAGQYMEWTLPGVAADSRGNRRYLTVASSPTEENLMFTVKIPSQSSSFKTSLMNMKPGDQILASQLGGDFTLPKDNTQKLAFIAGGVGITPFHSMLKYLVDTNQKIDAHLFYSLNSPAELAYKNLLVTAQGQGLKNHIVISKDAPAGWKGLTGYIDERLIGVSLPDYMQRHFYISGPQGFVSAVHQSLLRLGVEHAHIKTDFFPGYN